MKQDETQSFNEQQSLQLITDMIGKVKTDIKADAFIFLLWGWLVFIASISHYILSGIVEDGKQALPWMLMVVGGIVTPLYARKQNKGVRIRTYASDFMKHTWIAFSVALCVILFFNRIPYMQVMSLCMVLYGIGLYISGRVLKFKPLVFGGMFCWVCAAISMQMNNINVLLILALAVLGGYIIPGYLLKIENKKA